MKSLLIGAWCVLACGSCASNDPDPNPGPDPKGKKPDLLVEAVVVDSLEALGAEGDHRMTLTIVIKNDGIGKPGNPSIGPSVNAKIYLTAQMGLAPPDVPPVPFPTGNTSIGNPLHFTSANGPTAISLDAKIGPDKTLTIQPEVYFTNYFSGRRMNLYVAVDLMDDVAERNEDNNVHTISIVTPQPIRKVFESFTFEQ